MLVNVKAAEILKGALQVADTARQFMEQTAEALREEDNNNEVADAVDDIAKACQKLWDLTERRAAERIKNDKSCN